MCEAQTWGRACPCYITKVDVCVNESECVWLDGTHSRSLYDSVWLSQQVPFQESFSGPFLYPRAFLFFLCQHTLMLSTPSLLSFYKLSIFSTP